ncbi:Predicted signal transduction protein containing sensor and EAL domains [Klebsiella pneumoniae]|nr:Predicted signal transduction protein containing sensor and EAL domains [Klebsiella pneumoniae]
MLLVLNLYDMIFFPDCMRCSAPLQIRLCFEGVETQEQVNYLKTFWPQSYAQGWYYSRALPLEEARKLTIRELN